MDPTFLRFLLCLRTVKTLEEFGEANHVNQFMSNNIKGERKKVNDGIPLNRSSNHVILKADLEEVTGFTAARALMRVPQVAMDLRKGGIGNLLFLQVSKRLDVITIPLPLGRRNLIVLTEEFLREVDGLPQNGNFVRFEGDTLWLYWHCFH